MEPRGTVGRIYNEDYYALLHTKHKRTNGPVAHLRDFFIVSLMVGLLIWSLISHQQLRSNGDRQTEEAQDQVSHLIKRSHDDTPGALPIWTQEA